MASVKMVEAKQHLLKVKSYSIDQSKVLGQEALGIVFKGSNDKNSSIAAKRKDGEVHPQILALDFERFLQLDHPNVMKILDVEKNENIVWMMMPFCGFGDLNHFYWKRDVLHDTNVDIMKHTTAGIQYLHTQNSIHRDIKPGNILVDSQNPPVVQLTDFDLSKCLEPEVETSLMTSNVGTLAFKAPEFFQRTSPGKIEYHRNVDIYAAGLTFLAILQARKEQKLLIPQIESPMDDSELRVPSIGLLIAERIKYKVPELNIVKTEGPSRSLKWFISQMTSVNPEERLSAEKVLDILNNLESAELDFNLEVCKNKILPVVMTKRFFAL